MKITPQRVSCSEYGIKNCLILIFYFAPVLYSCNTGTEITPIKSPIVKTDGNKTPTTSPSPVEVINNNQPDKSSNPEIVSATPTITPVPTTEPSITPAVTPVVTVTPSPTASPENLQVDPNNTTGIYELRSHQKNVENTYLAICDNNFSVVAREYGTKFTSDVKFNDLTDYKGSKTKKEGTLFLISLTFEDKKVENPILNTTYEWKYNYQEGRIFDVKKIIQRSWQTIRNSG